MSSALRDIVGLICLRQQPLGVQNFPATNPASTSTPQQDRTRAGGTMGVDITISTRQGACFAGDTIEGGVHLNVSSVSNIVVARDHVGSNTLKTCAKIFSYFFATGTEHEIQIPSEPGGNCSVRWLQPQRSTRTSIINRSRPYVPSDVTADASSLSETVRSPPLDFCLRECRPRSTLLLLIVSPAVQGPGSISCPLTRRNTVVRSAGHFHRNDGSCLGVLLDPADHPRQQHFPVLPPRAYGFHFCWLKKTCP